MTRFNLYVKWSSALLCIESGYRSNGVIVLSERPIRIWGRHPER
jgi:hypothetical protein